MSKDIDISDYQILDQFILDIINSDDLHKNIQCKLDIIIEYLSNRSEYELRFMFEQSAYLDKLVNYELINIYKLKQLSLIFDNLHLMPSDIGIMLAHSMSMMSDKNRCYMSMLKNSKFYKEVYCKCPNTTLFHLFNVNLEFQQYNIFINTHYDDAWKLNDIISDPLFLSQLVNKNKIDIYTLSYVYFYDVEKYLKLGLLEKYVYLKNFDKILHSSLTHYSHWSFENLCNNSRICPKFSRFIRAFLIDDRISTEEKKMLLNQMTDVSALSIFFDNPNKYEEFRANHLLGCQENPSLAIISSMLDSGCDFYENINLQITILIYVLQMGGKSSLKKLLEFKSSFKLFDYIDVDKLV